MSRRLSGDRFVVGMYVGLVAFAVVTGVLFARMVSDPQPPALFFLVELPPTSLGFAVYGGVTVATVLGVPLLLVRYVSQFDDARIEDH